MVTVYATLIIKKRKKLSQVPDVIRSQVEEELKELLDVDKIPEELL